MLLQLPSSPTTPLSYVVLSALADGADRLVVREVMKCRGARLEAVLPFPLDEYRRDFSGESTEDFNALLSAASTVRTLPLSPERTACYERAGRSIVDRSDVLIALWDGAASRGRGGTAEIVEYAKRRGVPRIVISTVDETKTIETIGPDQAEFPKGACMSDEAFRRLDHYNREPIDGGVFADQLRDRLADVDSEAPQDATDSLPVKALSDWVLPYFVRADVLAKRHQAVDGRYGVLLFTLAAVAVVAVALQAQFFRETRQIVLIELLALVVIGVLLRTRRPLRAHERWITYRYLAEQLRSAFFLVMAGVDPPGSKTRERSVDESTQEDRLHEDASEEWIRRALEEVSSQRPSVEGPRDFGRLSTYLAAKWVDQQADYYMEATHSHKRQHDRLTGGIWALLVISVVVASLHIAGVGEGDRGEEESVGKALVVLSISLPACAAALGGIRELRDHRRHAERYERATRLLTAKSAKMRAARDPETIAAVAAEAARVMRDEGSDWFGVVRFEELDAL